VGDARRNVGLSYGKAKEVPSAIQRDAEDAQALSSTPLAGDTITHTSSASTTRR